MTIWLARFLLIFFLSCSLHLIHSWGNLTSHPNPLHHQNTHLLPSGQLKEQEVLLTVTGNQSNPAPLPADELGALHDLYSTTLGEYWNWTGVPWNFTESNPDPCSEGWEGVMCNAVCHNSSNTMESCEEHVVAIFLSNNNMSGSLPDSLQQLQQLRYLSISSNFKLTGSIPSSLSSLSYLIYLVLDSNGLSGSIPSSLTNVKSLVFLDLSENDLTGILPTNLSQLTGLSYFYIYSNHLSGSMPGDIGAWSQLSYLYAYSNLISGEFPESIANCSLLNTFTVYNNFMTGHLPPSVSKLKSLTNLDASYNMLSGSIPDDVGTASAMLFISLETNFFTGTLPSSIGQLSALTYFSVFDNILWGSLPSTIYDLSSIVEVSLSTNTFSGSLSSAIGQWTAMAYLDISENYFAGSLPGALGQLEKLEVLSGSLNVLSGALPAELGNCKSIVEVYLSGNWFDGTIPASFGNLTVLKYLYLDDSFLTGVLPSEMASLQNLNILAVENNILSGTIPDCLSNISSLLVMGLGINNFHGSLPAHFGRLTKLQYLTVSFSGFSGSLPASFSTLSNLQAASLACNFLSGSLSPLSIPSSHLDYLNISNNYFTGETSPLLSLQNISILDISSNGLTGSFQVHEKMPKLVWLFLRGNELSGSLSGTFTSLSTPSLVYLDLSNNRFSGAFPASDFAQLTKLNTLAAVENCFTGTISSDLCKASKLQVAALDGLSAAPSCRRATLSSSDGTLSSWVPSYVMGKHAVHGSLPSCLFQELNVLVTLHLSGNSLKGTIPDLAKHSLLSDLSLSHNELSGTVPDSVQSNSWINLDLSFNKLTGILKNSMSSTDWANASIALDINRLSGKIPSDYYHIGDVDMLRGNIFQCPDDGNDEESLPPSDPYNNQYGCGSEKLNTALIIWGSVVVCLGVVCVCIAGSMKMRSSRQREDVKSKYSKDIACCGKRKQNEEKEVSEDVGEGEDLEKRGEGATSKDEEKGKSSAQSATCWDRFLDKVEMMRKQMEEWQSVYGGENDEVKDALRRQDNTYRGEDSDDEYDEADADVTFQEDSNREDDSDDEYYEADIKILEGAYLRECSHVDETHADSRVQADREPHSINNPVAVLRSQIVMVGQLSRFVRQFSSVAMLLIVLLGVPLYTTLSYFYGSYDHQYGWTPSAAFLSGESAAIALLILFLGIAASLAFFIASRGSSSFYHANDQQNGRHVSIKWWWYGWSVACESSESWRYFLRVLVIVAGNTAVVMVVNAVYVYFCLQISVLQSFFLSVAMTGFKLVWSRILFLVLSHWIARVGERGITKEVSHPGLSCTDTVAVTSGDGVKNNLARTTNRWNSATITIYSCLMLFNTIVAPCLATLFISSDCFYYVFVSPPYVTVSYSYPVCITIVENACMSTASVIKTSDFQPPFSYGYQCSSALLQEYGYVFVYKYLLLGVLHPLVVLLLTFYHDQQMSSDESENIDGAEKKEEGSMAERGVVVSREFISPLHIRSGDVAIDANTTSPKPNAIRSISLSSTTSLLLPPLWRKNISHGIMSYFLDETNFEHVFSAAEYSVRLSMMIGTLLTYGIVLPYLAVLVCVAIVSNTYLTQWALARFYQMAWKASKNNHHDRLSSSLRLHSNDSKMSATVPESEWNADGSREAVRHVKVVSFSSSCSSVRTDNQALVVQHVSDECEQLPAALLVAARPLSVLMLFFLSCFLFDIAGDKGGAWIGLYFVLVMCLVPLLAVIVHRLWLGWMERRRLMHEEVVRNQASREGFGLLDGFGDRETVYWILLLLNEVFVFCS